MRSINIGRAGLREFKHYLRETFQSLYFPLPQPVRWVSSHGRQQGYLRWLGTRIDAFAPLAPLPAARLAILHATAVLDYGRGPTCQTLARCAYYLALDEIERFCPELLSGLEGTQLEEASFLLGEIEKLREVVDRTLLALPYTVDKRPLWELVESHFIQLAGKGFPSPLLRRSGILLKIGLLSRVTAEDLAFAYLVRRLTLDPATLEQNARVAYMDLIADAIVSGMEVSRTAVAKLQLFAARTPFWGERTAVPG